MSPRQLSDKCIVVGVCVLHGDSYLTMPDYLLNGGYGYVLVDETTGACVTCYVRRDAFANAKVAGNLLNLLVVVAVASYAEEVVEIVTVSGKDLFGSSIEQGKQGDVYGYVGLDGGIG